MEYWDVVVVIISIVGLFATVLPFFTKLNRTLGALNATVDQMQKVINNFEKNSRETHGRLYDKLDDHEKRISRLEK